MKKLIFFLLSVALSNLISAQDIIIKKNGDELSGKVQEITLTEVKYKKADNPDGPVISILKGDVFMIKYENGTKDVFEKEEIEEEKLENSYTGGYISELTKIANTLKKANYPLNLVLIMNEKITYGRDEIITNPNRIKKRKEEFIDAFFKFYNKNDSKFNFGPENSTDGPRLIAIVEPQYTLPGYMFKFYYRVTYGLIPKGVKEISGINDLNFNFLFGYSLYTSDNDYYHAAAHLVGRVFSIYRDLITGRYIKVGFFKNEELNFISKKPAPIGTEIIK
ncbi:MAG: hypothetical protein HXX09_13725 [Bacteroidetes bacterium]|nr:hypothetical protein [Bacteroidota bacterium]